MTMIINDKQPAEAPHVNDTTLSVIWKCKRTQEKSMMAKAISDKTMLMEWIVSSTDL